MEKYLKPYIKVFDNGGEVILSEDYGDVLLNDYLEMKGFYHLKQDIYTEDDLEYITKLLNDYNSCNKVNINYAVDIATNWWVDYLMTPTLRNESSLKTFLRLFISWRSAYQYDNSMDVIEKLERELRSRIRTELVYNDEIIVASYNNSLLQVACEASNYVGLINDDIRMNISKNKIILWIGTECQTLYYNYEKSKKK